MKFTYEQAQLIKNDPLPVFSLARQYGVSQRVIVRIKRGKTYSKPRGKKGES